MLTKPQNSACRKELFRHLDGIAVAPVAFTLHEKGVLTYILQHKQCSLSQLADAFSANDGYLNVALRVLASQGWLSYQLDLESNEITVSANELSAIAFEHVHLYKDVAHLLKFSEKFHPRRFELEPFQVLERIFTKYMAGYGVQLSADLKVGGVQAQILKHIEGILVGPTVVLLGMGGMFHKYFMEASFRPDEYHKDPESFEKILRFLTHIGWFQRQKDTFQFTDKGLFFAKRSSAYGVTVSYIPTFRKMDELLFGNPEILWDTEEGAPEKHVDREMNVWGSGGAHAAYFKKIDEVVTDLFNRPINEQPKGILDMGCGNGAFLIHLFEVIEQRTARGKMLEEHPLFLVGVDYNKAALKVTRANIVQSDIWAKVIWGDISDPEGLATDLKANYNIDLSNLLNVRTFLDHNRIWATPKQASIQPATSSGAFAYRGKRLNNVDVEQNLREHLQQWLPYVKKFGLLVIELHTIAPSITSQNLGKTAATAYDATHGFSDQYILEIEVFNRVAADMGLIPQEKFFSKFPNSELATVSINYLKGVE